MHTEGVEFINAERLSYVETSAIDLKLWHCVQNGLTSRHIMFGHLSEGKKLQPFLYFNPDTAVGDVDPPRSKRWQRFHISLGVTRS